MSSIKTLSFDEIIPGNSVRVTSDGMIHAVDLAMVITGTNRNYAGQVLRRLPEEVFSSSKLHEMGSCKLHEMGSCKLHETNTSGFGNGRTKLVSFNDALELIMVLPGKMAKEMRSKFADIIKRYLAGDGALLKEVQANANSSHPIAQMARESLAADMSPEDKALETRKRKLEIDMMEQNMRKEELQMRKEDLQMQKDKFEFTRLLSRNGVVDDQVRMMFKDVILNSLRNDSGQGQAMADLDLQPVCLSAVSIKLGFNFDDKKLQDVGRLLKVAYVNAYGTDPGKYDSKVEGRACEVNLYTKKDIPMIEQVMRDFQAKLKRAGHNKTLTQFWPVGNQ